MINMKESRGYSMQARAASAEATRQRILDAAIAELWGRRVTDVRLEDIALGAGVTVQTVLRVFGSRAQLIDLAWDTMRDRILEQREAASPGDIAATIRVLYDHYEEMGDFIIRNLADEDQRPEMKGWLERGRKAHRRSMQRQFEPWLEARAPSERRVILDCLVATCDVYTWKLLRRDMGRTRSEAEDRVARMLSGIVGGH
jgi:AcrR family transcriptional regulator